MRVRGVVLLLAGGCGAALAAAPAQADIVASVLVDQLNAQRAAHGFPAQITENPSWSDECAKHVVWEREDNGGALTHSASGTADGRAAAGNSVLYSGTTWTAASNPFEHAPIHLAQVLAPRLDETGAAEVQGFGCLQTLRSRRRAAPARPVVYTYPANGTTAWRSSEVARELPFVPGEKVTPPIPPGTATGPYLYLYPDGPERSVWDRAIVESARLSGPGGPVEIATVDSTTPDVNLFLPSMGMVIPRAPLDPSAAYRLDATLLVRDASRRDDPGQRFVVTSTFATGSAPVAPGPGGALAAEQPAAAQVAPPAPPAGAAVSRTPSAPVQDALPDPAGPVPDGAPAPVAAAGAAVRPGPPAALRLRFDGRATARTVQVTLPPAAVGHPGTLTFRGCGRVRCTRTVRFPTLPAIVRRTVPRGFTGRVVVRLAVPAFVAADGTRYRAAELTRTWG